MDDAISSLMEPENDQMIEDFSQLLEESFQYNIPRRGEIRNGIILQINERDIIVDLKAKEDGIVPAADLERMDEEFRASLHVNDEIPVYIVNPRDNDGNLIVSINMGLQRYDWDEAQKALKDETALPVKVAGFNKGGVLVRWRRLEGFIPSSHLASANLASERREALNALIGETLNVKVIEVDQDRRRLIFSEREAQKEWRTKQKTRLLDELNVGDVVKGTVTGLRDFGAFVNIGGADGLIHVSELAWHRVDHPRDILDVGDKIDVYILSLDPETRRIALSRKRLLPDPWELATASYHEGQLVEGIVTNVVDFGAFVALDDGLEGLLHLSEMGDGSLKEPFSYLQKSDRLTLRISHLEPEKRRVGFTQRWGTENEGETPAPPAAEGSPTEEPAAEAVAPADAEAAASDVEAAADVAVDAVANAADAVAAAPAVVAPEAPDGEEAADAGDEPVAGA
jgi:small subunit ribosomal protein S1